MNAAATGSRPTRALVLLLAIAAVGISLLATSRYGPRITPDSVAYVTAATSLVSEGEYLSYDRPFFRWPPLYPTLLAAPLALGVDVVAGARFLNAAALFALVLAAWSLFRDHIRDPRLALAGTFAVAVSSPIHFVAMSLWSETLFILFILLFLLSLKRFLANPAVGPLLLVSILAACAVMQRYAGVAVLATGGIAILVLTPRTSLGRRVGYLATFSALSTIPLLFWIRRTYSLSGTPIGGRGPSSFSPVEVLELFFETIFAWYAPRRFLSPPVLVVATIAAVALGTFLVVWWRRKGSADSRLSSNLWPVTLFVAVYTSFSLGTSIRFGYDSLGDRILSPLAVYVVFFAFLAIQAVATLTARGEPEARGSVLRSSLLALMIACLLAVPLIRTGTLTVTGLAEGAGGYNSTPWQESEALEWLRGSPEDGVVHSNAPDAVLFLTGRKARWSPRGAVDSLPAPPLDVLWFDAKVNPRVYTPEELAAFYRVEVVTRFADGVLYSLRSRDQLGERSDLRR